MQQRVEEEKVVISFLFQPSSRSPGTARRENAGDSIYKPNNSKLLSTENYKKQPSERQLL